MTEAISSFFDNIKQKTTNPFFGTLILVWSYRNWELIYTLLNFDSDSKLTDKTVFIKTYFSSRDSFWIELSINIGYALLFMFMGIVLIVGTRFVMNFVEHRITPHLYNKAISKLVVNKSVHQNTLNERDNAITELEKLKESNSRFITLNRELESSKNQMVIGLADTNQKLSDSQLNLQATTLIKNELEKKLNTANEEIIFDNHLIESLNKKNKFLDIQVDQFNEVRFSKFSDGIIENDVMILKSNNQIQYFKEIYFSIIKQNSENSTFDYKAMKMFEGLGLISQIDISDSFEILNTFVTNKGIILYNYILDKDIF